MLSVHSACWAKHLGRWLGPSLALRASHPGVNNSLTVILLWGLQKSECQFCLGGLCWMEFGRVSVSSPGKPDRAGLSRQRQGRQWKGNGVNKLSVGGLQEICLKRGHTDKKDLRQPRIVGLVFCKWKFLSKDVTDMNCSFRGHSGVGVEGALGKGEATSRRLLS